MMRSKLLVAGLLVALVVMPVQAQSSEYRLRQPSVYEMVQRMLEIGRSTATLDDPPFFYPTIVFEMSALLFHDYDQLVQVPFTDLLALYDALYIGYAPLWNRGDWGQALIHSWLNANQPDLSKVGQIGFADFRIAVIPRDFNGDGQNEYLLDFTKGGLVDRESCEHDAELIDYRIVQQEGNQYRFINHLVPFSSTRIGGAFNFGELGVMEIGFEDINADGLPEWLVLTGGETFGGAGMGYVNTGNLYVLAWRDGRMVDLAVDTANGEYPRSLTAYSEEADICYGTEPRDIRWEFRNIDDDPALEILQRQSYMDNWYCETVETKVLDWDATTDHYRLQATERGFAAETRQCAQRQAEEAMWAGDYPQAIRLYQSAGDLPPTYPDYLKRNDEEPDRWAKLALEGLDEYRQLRLALAYILTGQPEKARITRATLPDNTFSSSTMKAFADVLREHLTSPLQACLAVYNLFTTNYPNIVLGTTLETTFLIDTEYAPERIGCDGPQMIETLIEEHSFSTDETPVDFIESLDLPVFRTITADFDDDGDLDWLVWLDSLMPPFAVVHMDNGYRVSRPPIDPYRQAESLDVYRLPGEAGLGVVYFDLDYYEFQDVPPWAFVYYRQGLDNLGSPSEHCVGKDQFPPVEMMIWRVIDGEWVKIFRHLVCAADLAEAFPQGEGSEVLAGGETVYLEMFSEESTEAGYNLNFIWDAEAMTYVSVEKPAPTPTPMPYVGLKYYSISDAYEAGDYTFIVEDGAALINPQSSTAEERGWSYRYFRGLALEALDRPEEALAEYVRLIENVPDSLWGQLAALHLVGIGG